MLGVHQVLLLYLVTRGRVTRKESVDVGAEKENGTLWSELKSKPFGEFLLSQIRAWWRSFDTPNPWSAELDIAVRAPDAIPVCHRCMTPCDIPVWFCPSCGVAVGPYNNVMEYINIFSIGEALRSGVGPEAHFTPFRTVAYVSIGLAEYGVFAPLYFIRLYLNYRRLKGARDDGPNQTSDATSEPAPGADSSSHQG